MKRLKDGRGILSVGRTTVAILDGDEDLSSWSDEELRRGQRRDKNGNWGGRPPSLYPRQIHDEIVKRKLSKAFDLLKKNSWRAVRVLTEIATDRTVDPAIRLRAATEVLDRTLGKPTENVNMNLEVAPWQRLAATAIVPELPGEDAIVDGEVVEAVDGEIVEPE